MSGKIVKLVNQKSVGPEAIIRELEDILAQLKSGKLQYHKMALLMLDDQDEKYGTFRSCIGMRYHEVVALLEVCKNDIIHEEMR